MLDFQIIREDIQPTVEKINSFNFIPGEKRTLAIQLLNQYNKKPYFLPSLWQASMEFKTTDPDVPLLKTMTVDSVDRSILTVVLSSTETLSLISAKLKLTISEIADSTNKKISLKDGIFIKTKEIC